MTPSTWFPEAPAVLAETRSFIVICKPPFMHSAPLKDSPGNTLLDWCAGLYPEVRLPGKPGEVTWEGGLLHRLDFETHGLVLIARTAEALAALKEQQARGTFAKEYGALSAPFPPPPLPGFPERPEIPTPPFAVESAFRPYGPGRAAVRPIVSGGGITRQKPRPKPALDQGAPYRTEVLEMNETSCLVGEVGAGKRALYFRLRITRGFRHQIRCHLAWLGYPILNDRLYGSLPAKGVETGVGQAGPEGYLALRAQGISFLDPLSGEPCSYTLPPLYQT
ncbi:ribosomal large subunit pseudouridine synthase D [Treponema primitia ZAS-2]|uniref:Ribosomal large subunit pseudouridine synthase D n=1 Tax=Treponema primitia (strain ATCC BAA-887 / DSM 12427 / ZAS-2) TaxID=545694 RepID=F5YHG5_TREPZ|nr:pseudouridine synthase [Treponema primitia]AEF85242.1 ribosomal large subunit pseudouridine synthase D [Treponema primitia ZAS-2]